VTFRAHPRLDVPQGRALQAAASDRLLYAMANSGYGQSKKKLVREVEGLEGAGG
jgi:hypothetical protein